MTDQDGSNLQRYPWWVTYTAGGLAGAGVDAILFPIDTLKTRLQLRNAGKVVKKDWYAGLGINTVGSFLSAGVFFLAYERTKQHLQPLFPPLLHPVAHMASAAVADVFCCNVRVPFELLKQRLQAGLEPTTWKACQAVYRSAGLRGFYAGFASMVLREVPFDALEFAFYEFLKRKFLPDAGSPSPLASALVGAAAGGAAAGATAPFDVIKTRLMTQTTARGSELHYAGVVDCVKKVWASEGSRGFLHGIVPRTVWIALGGSIFFCIYETSKRNIHAFTCTDPTAL